MRRSSGAPAWRTESSWPWLTITCCWRPTPASERSSCMSSSRQGAPFSVYSLSPVLNSVLVIVTSATSTGRRLEALSIVRDTSARPSVGRLEVPAKMTSSIFVERTTFGPWAPRTQATASTTFDLPEPFGPTTTVMPGSSSIVVGSANDLKPLRVSVFKNTLDRRYPCRSRTPGIGRAPRLPQAARCSKLAALAHVRGACPDLEPHDTVPATSAWLPRPVVDGMTLLIGPQVAGEVPVAQVPQRRPSRGHGLAEHGPSGLGERGDLLCTQRAAGAVGPEPCPKTDLVGVDAPDAGDYA